MARAAGPLDNELRTIFGDVAPPVAEDTRRAIYIGTFAPLSGPDAPWGAAVRGLETYFRMINQDGGLSGRTLKLVYFDTGSKPDTVVGDLKRILEGGPPANTGNQGSATAGSSPLPILAFVAGAGPGECLAALSYLRETDIPWVGPMAGLPVFSTPPQPNIFALHPFYYEEAAALVKYSVEVMKRNKIGLYYQDDEFGRAGRDGALAQLKSYNLRPAVSVGIRPDDADPRDSIFQLKDASPDAVLVWTSPIQAARLRKMADRINIPGKVGEFKPIWLAGSGLADVAMMNRFTGGRWIGTIFTAFADAPGISKSPHEPVPAGLSGLCAARRPVELFFLHRHRHGRAPDRSHPASRPRCDPGDGDV